MHKRTTILLLVGAAAVLVGLAGCFAFFGGGSQVEHDNVAFNISPDGKQVVFSSADADLYLLDLKTRRVRRLTNSKAVETAPAFSPDGKSIAYVSDVQGSGGTFVFVRSLNGTQVQRLTRGRSVGDTAPCFSPDGKHIAFVRARRPGGIGLVAWHRYGVYIMDRNGSNLRRLTHHEYSGAGSPCFVNGGKTLIFAANGDYPDTLTYLFTVPADGSQPPTLLTKPPKNSSSFSSANPNDFAVWGSDPYAAPGGKRLVFLSDRASAFDYDIWVMEADGTNPRPLKVTGISKYNQGPVFTPDGRRVLFLAGTEWNASSRPIFSLWAVGTDGKNARRIADSGVFTNPLGWKPKP